MRNDAGLPDAMTGDGPAGCGIVGLPCFTDPRGMLTVLEGERGVPFRIARAFWMNHVPSGRGRGGHAHREQSQLIVAVNGSFTVILDDGETTRPYRLDNPSEGLLVCPGVWNILENFSEGAVCMVFASGLYDENEYIREYPDFLAFRAAQASCRARCGESGTQEEGNG